MIEYPFVPITESMRSMAEKLGVTFLDPQELQKIDSLQNISRKKQYLGIGSDYARQFLELSAIIAISDYEDFGRDSVHYRTSGLNQVLCAIAHRKDKVILFNVGRLIHCSLQEKILLLGKMKQNVQLCRKYKVKVGLITGAVSEWDLRAPAEMIAIGHMLGMTYQEARLALEWL